jgi:hypothetical protein
MSCGMIGGRHHDSCLDGATITLVYPDVTAVLEPPGMAVEGLDVHVGWLWFGRTCVALGSGLVAFSVAFLALVWS